MNSQLRNMMAEIESWESATEFGISEDLWAHYQVRNRSDDLYIAALAAIFDTLRLDDESEKQKALGELSKTLLIYSRSTASKYLKGVDRDLNLLYCAATFYLAGFPATATFVALQMEIIDNFSREEEFLTGLLSRKLDGNQELDAMFLDGLTNTRTTGSNRLRAYFQRSLKAGLVSDPRLFIVSKLTLDILDRFSKFNIWSCLERSLADYRYESWRPFLLSPDSFPLWELFPSQMIAIESGILDDVNKVYSMQMPTSSGKTSLCEIIIYNEVKIREKKVLFLVPFRALAAEIKEGISKRLKSAGVSVIASHGGNIPSKSEGVSAETADVLIITPEKFSALVQNHPGLEDQFTTIICDEGHLIDDSGRGLQYELLLTKLKTSEDILRKIIFISAILPNVDEIHAWLGGSTDTLATSKYKPVETDYAIITSQDRTTSWQLDFNTIYARPKSYFLRSFITQDDFRYLNTTTGRLNLIGGYRNYISLSCATALKARGHGPVALFTTMKSDNGVSGLAKKLISLCELEVKVAMPLPAPSESLVILLEYMRFQFGDSYLLTRLLNFGMGLHHGDLPQEIRREMEDSIQNGSINLLICTSTLAEGVNLPIRTLVVHTIKRFDGDVLTPIEQRSIKNIVGRVGRAGKETRGRVIFANDTERAYIESVFRESHMESAQGSLFRLISNLNRAVSSLNIQLTNEIFESQNDAFLKIIDGIDTTLIDLIPPQITLDEIESYVEGVIEKTLAFQYCNTDELKGRIKEVFVLRAQHLQAEVPREQWGFLKRSGASPRFWKFVESSNLLDHKGWLTLSEVSDESWIDELVLKVIEMPTLQFDQDINVTKLAVRGWMGGASYMEINENSEADMRDTLKLLGHSIGYQLQDCLGKLSQLAEEHYVDFELSELATSWPSLLQYGLGSLQQLDLFERGVTDRLAVWGLSRYMNERDIDNRGDDLVNELKTNSIDVNRFLELDERVPELSRSRACLELGISF